MRKKALLGLALLSLAGSCSQRDQDKAKEKIESARDKATQAADRAEEKAKQLTDEASRKLDQSSADAKASTDKAADKIQKGADDLKSAGAQAASKLDRASTITQAKAQILKALGVKDATAIEVDAGEHTVTLTGKVPTLKEKLAAEDAVLGVSGVTKVDNNLRVEP